MENLKSFKMSSAVPKTITSVNNATSSLSFEHVLYYAHTDIILILFYTTLF